MEKKIVKWIKNQLKRAKAKGIVMGISGGVDSSVVAVLAQKAAGKNLLCLILPCHSLREDLDDAKLVAKRFKLKTNLIDLANIYDNFMRILPKADLKTKGNLKARLRMLTLYYFANKLNYLVAGTGNKSEIYAGYFTKHGDSAVDILPIGGLFKTQIKILARCLNIPEKIITKPPSAGLWKGQTDEAEMGITYNDLDCALRCILEKKKMKNTKHINKVRDIIAKTEHKRRPAAICYY